MCILTSQRPVMLCNSRIFSPPGSSTTIQPHPCSRATAWKNSCHRRATAYESGEGSQTTESDQSHACGARRPLEQLGVGILAHGVVALPARADVLERIQEGSTLLQKDAVISVAFTAAVVALGAVTLGVSCFCIGLKTSVVHLPLLELDVRTAAHIS
jgi:hypothetical protein